MQLTDEETHILSVICKSYETLKDRKPVRFGYLQNNLGKVSPTSISSALDRLSRNKYVTIDLGELNPKYITEPPEQMSVPARLFCAIPTKKGISVCGNVYPKCTRLPPIDNWR